MLSRIVMVAGMALCLGNAPIAPLIEGSFDGVVEAARAARQCGFRELRMQVHDALTMMYDEGGPSYGRTEENMLCLARWARINSKKLSISWVPSDPRR